MISDDRFFEMITAGIGRQEMPDAEVLWNQKINDRQFDVLATVKIGMHRLLLAYEVKHKNRPTEVGEIEAFITKANDVNANKLVFVSTKGFQLGCLEKAKKHGVDLFHLTLEPNPILEFPVSSMLISREGEDPGPPVLEVGEEVQANAISNVRLIYRNGQTIAVPDEPSQMAYCIRRTKTATGKTLHELIDPHAGDMVDIGAHYDRQILVGEVIIPPDEFFLQGGFLEKITIVVTGTTAKLVKGNVRFEASALAPLVQYKNILTNEVFEGKFGQLPIGEAEFTPGNFYFAFYPLSYFHCDSIEGEIATISIVESFQMGMLSQGTFTCEKRYAKLYIPVPPTNKSLVKRLEKRLLQLRQRPSNTPGKWKGKLIRSTTLKRR